MTSPHARRPIPSAALALALAATLACRAPPTEEPPPAATAPPPRPEVTVTDEPARHDFPLASRYVTIDGQRMHFVESGQGDPILFVHGNPTWSYLWRHVLPELEGRGRLIAVDLVGFGRSDQPEVPFEIDDHARALAGFVAALDLRDVIVVGHDWGGFLALQWAAEHPDDVRGVALLETSLPTATGEPDVPEHLAERRDELWELFLATGGVTQSQPLVVEQNAFVERLLPLAVVRDLDDDELAAYREPFVEPSTRDAILRLRLSVGSPASRAVSAHSTAWLAETDTPVLLLTASPGLVGTSRQVEWVGRALPRIEIVPIGEGLHVVPEDRPHQIGAAIAGWMAAQGWSAATSPSDGGP